MKTLKNNMVILFILIIIGKYELFSLDFEWSEPENISILNSAGNEYGLIHNKYDNRIYFNSDKTGYSYFYISELVSDTFSEPFLLKNKINEPNNNQAYFTPIDKNTSYFTSFRMSKRRPYQNIFKSVNKKQEWTEPYILTEFEQDNYSGMTTISPDGNTIVYVSNSKNNEKETDLWIAYLGSDGSWGAAAAIEELNSTGNEITPFLKSNDTLFFASDGYGGSGGFDIYYSVRNLGIWQRPKPFQHINTEFNESDLVFLPGNRVVFASDRPGGLGNLDLYEMKRSRLNKTNESINEYKLSLAAQVPNIRLKRIRSKFIFPMPASINFEPEQIDYIVLDTIAERMKENDGAIIKIHSINQSDNIVRYLINKGIPESRISLDNSATSFTQYINISSANKKLLQPLSLQLFDYKFEPPVLELNLDAKPRNVVENWKLKAHYIGKDSILMEGNRLPAKLFYDIEVKSYDYMPFDSIKFEFVNTDDTLKNVKLNIPFRISEIFSHNVVKKDEFLYFEYNLFVNNRSDLKSINYEIFKENLQKINTDRVLILYKNNKYLNDVKKYINNIFSSVDVITMKNDENDFLGTDNLYKILIRKIE